MTRVRFRAADGVRLSAVDRLPFRRVDRVRLRAAAAPDRARFVRRFFATYRSSPISHVSVRLNSVRF